MTLAFPMPLHADNANANFRIDGRVLPDGAEPVTSFASIAPDYFRTLGIPLIRGRDFDEHDAAKSPGVAIVSQALARKYFPGEDPVGKRLIFGNEPNDPNSRVTIVGIVGDVKGYGLDRPAPSMLYFPYQQFTMPFMSLMVRTTAAASDVGQTVRSAVAQVDREQPVESVKTLDEMVTGSIAQPRFRTTLLSVFAIAALVLAIVGVYGVLSYAVAQRQRELGIRAALGAEPKDLLKLVIGQGLTLTATGIAAGLAGAFALSGLLAGMLYGVGATDLRTMAAAAIALLTAALLACALPAWRAMRLDPLVALRDE
jgi:predicted permease